MQTAHPVDIEGVGDTHTYFLQGLGLYAARDIEKHTMVIEYIGTIIRNEVANRKEKLYESQVSVTAPPSVPQAAPETEPACRAGSSLEQKAHLPIRLRSVSLLAERCVWTKEPGCFSRHLPLRSFPAGCHHIQERVTGACHVPSARLPVWAGRERGLRVVSLSEPRRVHVPHG